jgi:Ni,Fe-hydrogenase III small subunit/NAD-dependent dihydropyrimidine dehydrogenase PreA subunit
MPEFAYEECSENCSACVASCPTKAIEKKDRPAVDLGACIFCTVCESTCPSRLIRFSSKKYALSARSRAGLVVTGGRVRPAFESLDKKLKALFGRSLKFRQVSAGGCGACEADINVLSTVSWDIGRFGIQVVASPRHADGLLVTGPVTDNMRQALQKTYDALPAPKLVIAVGACAISGGIYRDSPVRNCGLESMFPVNLYIPGCPPHPLTILDGLLRLLGKL